MRVTAYDARAPRVAAPHWPLLDIAAKNQAAADQAPGGLQRPEPIDSEARQRGPECNVSVK